MPVKIKPQSHDDDLDTESATEFAAAREIFKPVEAGWRAKQSSLDDLRAAAVWFRSSDAERQSGRLAWVRDSVAKAWPNGDDLPKERRIPALIADAEDAIADFRPTYTAAAEAFEVAKRRRTSAVAKALQPRQKAAAVAIAKALSDLSVALAEERACHHDLARVAPHPVSSFLPNLEMEITVGSFDDWDSLASAWRRRMRQIGVLP